MVNTCDIIISSVPKIKETNNLFNEELFKKMKEGDKFAREDLIQGNLKLVLSILKKFSNYTDNLDDLFQVGCLGLLEINHLSFHHDD